ncbi:MFS transporter [Streptomyces iconiensis]|uniref:MFS transporter n=1 Tax=Streptomyces iconiensis TaxID=1384038 RepID=A0ABT6ZV90_9ACTN|nr:MFS transporter [Streptomyces iconiensis]MDJ1132978.1 MFS transporter [Streptomyces iconiensis]
MLTGTVLGSAISYLDVAVVNIALPSIGDYYDLDLPALQWVVNTYLLVVSSLLLVGGSLADRLGMRRIFLLGTVVFGAGSVLCGLALSPGMLLCGRAVQGLGAALLLPTSIPLSTSGFPASSRGVVVGLWTAFVGVGAILGPVLAGGLLDSLSWRWVFFLNVPLVSVSVVLILRYAPVLAESERRARPGGRPDLAGSLCVVVAFGALAVALIEGAAAGWGGPVVTGGLVVAAASFLAFPRIERRAERPVIPPFFFRARGLWYANGLTVAIYAGFNVMFFLTPLYLQHTGNRSAQLTALVILPVEVLLLLLSPLMGRLTDVAPLRPMLAVGTALCGTGTAVLGVGAATTVSTWHVLAGVGLFGLGFGIAVAPLNRVTLDSVPDEHGSTAFGTNHVVARVSAMIAVALVPLAAGAGSGYVPDGDFSGIYARGMLICAALLALGAAWAALVPLGPRRHD